MSRDYWATPKISLELARRMMAVRSDLDAKERHGCGIMNHVCLPRRTVEMLIYFALRNGRWPDPQSVAVPRRRKRR